MKIANRDMHRLRWSKEDDQGHNKDVKDKGSVELAERSWSALGDSSPKEAPKLQWSDDGGRCPEAMRWVMKKNEDQLPSASHEEDRELMVNMQVAPEEPSDTTKKT